MQENEAIAMLQSWGLILEIRQEGKMLRSEKEIKRVGLSGVRGVGVKKP